MKEVIFVPYAKANGDYDAYTKLMGDALSAFGRKRAKIKIKFERSIDEF